MDFEAYKVAVRVSMTENVTAGLLAISRKFGAANQDAERFQKSMDRIGKMALAGGALTAVGLIITKGLDSTIKAANDLVKAQNDFKTLNLSVQDNALVNATAQQVSHQVLGTTIAGNIRLIQDLHTALGSLPHSIELAPMFAKYESTIGMALGAHAKDGMVNAAARALEHRGGSVVNNPEEFKKELEWMSQVQLASKGRVSPKDFLAASQSGKLAFTGLRPEYLYGQFAGLMSMNGGFQTGTALMTTYSSLIGGHMDKKAKGALTEIGMYSEGVSKARMNSISKEMHGMTPAQRKIYMQSLGGEPLLSGGLKSEYANLFISNPFEFTKLMAKKIRERFGLNMSDEQVKRWMGENFNRNTSGFLGQNIINATKLDKDAAIFRHSMNFDKAYDTYLNSPDGAGMALSSAWTNVKAVLGLQLIPTLTKVTLSFAGFMDKVSEFAENNPWATKIAMYSATALAGLTLLSGGILLLGATITAARLVGSLGVVSSFATLLGGPVVWAIVAAAGAGLLIYKNWDKIKPAGEKMGKEFAGIMSSMWGRMKQVGTYISNWSVWGALASFGQKLESGFNSIFDTIIGYMNKIPGVHILTSGETKLQNKGLELLQDINSATGGPKLPNSLTATGTPGAQSMAAGYAAANGRTTVPVPAKSGQMIQVNSTIKMDSKPIANAVTQHQTREASKPPSSISAFDSSMLQTYSGLASKVSTN